MPADQPVERPGQDPVGPPQGFPEDVPNIDPQTPTVNPHFPWYAKRTLTRDCEPANDYYECDDCNDFTYTQKGTGKNKIFAIGNMLDDKGQPEQCEAGCFSPHGVTRGLIISGPIDTSA
ncbi:MAG: hypothetical protein ACJAR1_001595 [Rubritalea sp.]